MVLVNLTGEPVDWTLPDGVRLGDAELDNGAGPTAELGAGSVPLAPWQATVYRCPTE